MQQYFIQESLQVGQEVQLDANRTHHIKNVIKLKDQSIVKLVDKDAHAFLTTLHTKPNLVAHVDEALDSNVEQVQITLYQGVMKGERFDYCIQKACELGVYHIVPMTMTRSVVKFNDKVDRKVERYNKIALEACEQSKRDHLVQVASPVSIASLTKKKDTLQLLAFEGADVKISSLKSVILQYPEYQHIEIVIGCEGGFTNKEVDTLVTKGFVCISLGKRILRAETASLALINSLLFYYE